MHRFRRVAANIDVSAINEQLANSETLWTEITARQDFDGTAHVDTETIFLLGPAELTAESAQHSLSVVSYPPLRLFWPDVADIVEPLEPRLGITEYGRAMIVKLKPGGRIAPHTDEGGYAEHFSRLHIVLQSDPGNRFECGNESAQMLPGEAWWFDHQVEHSAANNSKSDRIHLIMDVVASELPRLKQGQAEFMANLRSSLGHNYTEFTDSIHFEV